MVNLLYNDMENAGIYFVKTKGASKMNWAQIERLRLKTV